MGILVGTLVWRSDRSESSLGHGRGHDTHLICECQRVCRAIGNRHVIGRSSRNTTISHSTINACHGEPALEAPCTLARVNTLRTVTTHSAFLAAESDHRWRTCNCGE